MKVFSKHSHLPRGGFTIVELLIVIVVIGILATIVIVAYNGVRAKAIDVSLQSDLRNAHGAVRLAELTDNVLPTDSSSFKASNGGTYQYSFDNNASPRTFCITENIGRQSYFVDENGSVKSGTCPGYTINLFNTIAWAAADTSRAWRGVAMSGDGTKLFGVNNGGFAYTSSSAPGAAWTPRDIATRAWYAIASSADGSTVFAVTADSGTGGRIYRSTDSGVTWTPVGPTKDFRSITVSASGLVAVALPYYGYPSISIDGGTGWVDQNVSNGMKYYANAAISADGTKIYITDPADQTYISSNYGSSWNTVTGFGGQQRIATSSDGFKLMGVKANVVTSISEGIQTTYAAPSNGQGWNSLAMSADGTKVAGTRSTDGVFVSKNSGQTWTKQSITNGPFSSIAMNAKGSYMLVGQNTGTLYIGTYD